MLPRIVFAFDSFKGSLSSVEAGEYAAAGAEMAIPGIIADVIPIADGGEGTMSAIVASSCGRYVTVRVNDPLGRLIDSVYGICDDTAVIEVASASGLTLLKEEERDPMTASSFGTGEQIKDAIGKGCRKFLIGLGGSAVNDAGAGMLRALGYRFLDSRGNIVEGSGSNLDLIASINDSLVMPELMECEFTIACDVSNPLAGDKGASMVFAPQKGASPEMCQMLDVFLSHFADVSEDFLGSDFAKKAGSGAAGGLGFALMAFLGAKRMPGVDMVLDMVDFNRRIENASLIFTGEGRLDRQTCMGKAPSGVLARALKANIPVIAIGGSIDSSAVDELVEAGFAAVFPMIDAPRPVAEAMDKKVAGENLQRTVRHILRILRQGILS